MQGVAAVVDKRDHLLCRKAAEFRRQAVARAMARETGRKHVVAGLKEHLPKGVELCGAVGEAMQQHKGGWRGCAMAPQARAADWVGGVVIGGLQRRYARFCAGEIGGRARQGQVAQRRQAQRSPGSGCGRACAQRKDGGFLHEARLVWGLRRYPAAKRVTGR